MAALRATPERLLAEPEALGPLFESLVIRDLRIYADAADAEVFSFTDAAGAQADAIVDARDGRWIAVAVKLGGVDAVEQAAALPSGGAQKGRRVPDGRGRPGSWW